MKNKNAKNQNQFFSQQRFNKKKRRRKIEIAE
jgi:hypothetical protein